MATVEQQTVERNSVDTSQICSSRSEKSFEATVDLRRVNSRRLDLIGIVKTFILKGLVSEFLCN